MYLITLYNDDVPTIIHSEFRRVADAKITRAKNAIASLTFTIYPDNDGYDLLTSFSTLITVVDLSTGETEFDGHVLVPKAAVDASGIACKKVTCEDFTSYLCDSRQPYTAERTWELAEFVDYLLENHNSRVEDYKKIYRGTVDVSTYATTENVTKGTNFERTFDIFQDKLIDVFGGEMRVRRGDDGLLYLDYREMLGDATDINIAIARNIKEATREPKPDDLITRLYPRGCKLTVTETDENGNEIETETEERLSIASVNNGVEYIDDEEAMAVYGIHEGTHEWDDVSEPLNLLAKSQTWLKENNSLPVANTISAYDLSLLGLDPDRFRLYNWYPCYQPLVGLDETLEIVRHVLDINEPHKSTFELGDSTVLQSQKIAALKGLAGEVEYVKSQSKTNTVNIKNAIIYTMSAIEVAEDRIVATVGEQIVQTSEEIDGKITVISERVSTVEQTAESITATVTQLKADQSALQTQIEQTAESITATVTAEYKEYVDGKITTVNSSISEVKQTADSLTSTVQTLTENQETLQSQIEQLPDSITATITTAYQSYVDGKITTVNSAISELQLTADSFSVQIAQLEGAYGTCTTGSTTQEKTVTATGFKTLHAGATINVRFTYKNNIAEPMLNVNGTGAKYIYVNNAKMTSDYYWSAQDLVTFVYSGTYWYVADCGSKSAIVQLADSISLTVSNAALGSTASIVLSVDGSTQSASVDLTGVRNAFANDTSAITISAGKVSFEAGTFAVNGDQFVIDSDGNATFSGKLSAPSGTIGGFTIGSDALYSDRSTLSGTTAGVYVGNDGISTSDGSKSIVLASGRLYGFDGSTVTGYTSFKALRSGSTVYGMRIAGRGCVDILTDVLGVGDYAEAGITQTVYSGQTADMEYATGVSYNLSASVSASSTVTASPTTLVYLTGELVDGVLYLTTATKNVCGSLGSASLLAGGLNFSWGSDTYIKASTNTMHFKKGLLSGWG